MAGKELGRTFPPGFTWGTATAAHQIEGGTPTTTGGPSSTPRDPVAPKCPATAGLVEPLGGGRRPGGRVGLDDHRFSWNGAALAGRGRVRAGLAGALPAAVPRATRTRRGSGRDFHHFRRRMAPAQRGWKRPGRGAVRSVLCGHDQALGDVIAAPARSTSRTSWQPWAGMQGCSTGQDRRRALSFRGGPVRPAHRVAVDIIRAGAPGIPVGLTLSMTDYQLADGGEEQLASIRHDAEDVFSTPPRGRLPGRAGLHPRCSSGRRLGRLRGGRALLDMCYEFYPASWATPAAWDYTGGSVPLLVTENGIGTTDDAQRIDYVRQALSGVLEAQRRHRRARLHLLVAARQLRVGLGLPAQIRHRRRRPRHLRPDAEAECRVAGRHRRGQRPRRLRPLRPRRAPCWPRWRR